MTIQLVVASQNPVKLAAVEAGFKAVFPDEVFDVIGFAAASGVRAQPMGDDETLRGARNRALTARKQYLKADYTIGVEGGCAFDGDRISVFAWIFVHRADGQTGQSKTGTFYLPEEVAQLVRGGVELGIADDRVFGRSNSKQGSGSVGILTGDVITRQTYYSHAVTLALIPFLNPNLSF